MFVVPFIVQELKTKHPALKIKTPAFHYKVS
jgi:hypothetical protein